MPHDWHRFESDGRDEQGENVLRKAIFAAPQNAAVHHALGLALIRRKQLDEGVRYARPSR
jgi:hypothetical protein